jgi:hypothetical protein
LEQTTKLGDSKRGQCLSISQSALDLTLTTTSLISTKNTQ